MSVCKALSDAELVECRFSRHRAESGLVRSAGAGLIDVLKGLDTAESSIKAGAEQVRDNRFRV